MNLSENLQFLRKRDKITQEELADKLGVSRQSISKWETGEAYPETDKLINICELFDITLDALLREKISETPDSPMPELKETTPNIDANEFHRHMKNFAGRISLGVFLIIFGTALCVFLAGIAQNFGGKTENFLNISSAIAVLIPVAGAVFLFIFSGIRHSEFQTEHPVVQNVVTKSERLAFNRKFSIALACLVSGIILAVVFLIIMTALVDSEIVRVANKDSAACYITSAFLAAVSAMVAGLVYFGIRHSEFHTSEYNNQIPKHKSKKFSSVNGAIMLTATAIFLTIGFVWNTWHPTWAVFPIGGILCGIIDSIFNIADKDDEENSEK